MAYRRVHGRVRARRGMSGLQSQPPGLPVASTALGALGAPVIENVPIIIPTPHTAVSRYRRGIGAAPDWYRFMQGTSLGADDQGSLTQPTIVEAGPQMMAWQNSLISQSQANNQTIQKYMQTETQQRWFQIAATLSIPLAAAIWRMIFGVGRQS